MLSSLGGLHPAPDVREEKKRPGWSWLFLSPVACVAAGLSPSSVAVAWGGKAPEAALIHLEAARLQEPGSLPETLHSLLSVPDGSGERGAPFLHLSSYLGRCRHHLRSRWLRGMRRAPPTSGTGQRGRERDRVCD